MCALNGVFPHWIKASHHKGFICSQPRCDVRWSAEKCRALDGNACHRTEVQCIMSLSRDINEVSMQLKLKKKKKVC